MNLSRISRIVPGIVEKFGSQSRALTSSTATSTLTKEIVIPVPWGEITAKTWGNEEGKPVLCVHGWQDNAATFDTLIPLLPSTNYYVAVELQGHGLSSHLPPGMTYNYMDYFTTMRRIVNYLNWKKFSWIGHSLGSGLGALYASIFNSEVERLVMIDLIKAPSTPDDVYTIIGPETDYALSKEKSFNSDPPGYTYEEACQRLQRGTDNSLTKASAQILLSRGLRNLSNDKWAYTKDFRLHYNDFVSGTRFSDSEWCDILNNIRCHTMFIKFSEYPWWTKKETCDQILEIFKKNCASFHYLKVPGTHFDHLNEPTKISDNIIGFLNGTLKTHVEKQSLSKY